MKKLIYKTLISGAMLTLLASCHKEDTPEPDAVLPIAASAEQFQELRKQALEELMQTETFNAEDGIAFTSAEGAQVYLSPGSLLDEDDNPVTGEVTLSFIELYDRGSMVVANKPLMGRNPVNGTLEPLVTGGQYYIEVKQDEDMLKTAYPFTVRVPTAPTGGVDVDMILWDGEIDDDGNLVWTETDEEDGDLLLEEVEVFDDPDNPESSIGQLVGDYYDTWHRDFGWINCDRFWRDPRPKTSVDVTVPAGFGNENCAVYLAFEGEPNVLAQLYDPTGDSFFSYNGEGFPIGLTVHVIFTSERDGDFLYTIKTTTVQADVMITIAADELKTATKDQLTDLVNALY